MEKKRIKLRKEEGGKKREKEENLKERENTRQTTEESKLELCCLRTGTL